MARTSRKALQNKGNDTFISKYNTGIYARLSVEDNRNNGNSIENQITLIKNYVESKNDLKLVKIYVDNGATGTNYNRSGFIAMMDDVKRGYISCIVIKDLSRLGRNYIETGDFLEKIFPNLGVRLISVNDNFDSIHADNSENLIMALKNLVHDAYATDISRKICTLFDIKKKNGEYLGKFAPYGYIKSWEDKHKLVINEETAPVIKQIFKWKLEGFGVTEIAKKLNNMDVPCQHRYLYNKEMVVGKNGEDRALWRGSSVAGILENPNYIGCIVQRKSEQAHYKGGQVAVIPKNDWILIENTHEAIVEKNVFYSVQKIPKKHIEARPETDNMLKGLLVCGVCGAKMVRGAKTYPKNSDKPSYTYYCTRKYIKKDGCSSFCIGQSRLEDAILKGTIIQIKLLCDLDKIAEEISKTDSFGEEKAYAIREMQFYQSKLHSTKGLKKSLYTDFKGELLTENEYHFAKEKYQNDLDVFSDKISSLQAQLDELSLMSNKKSHEIQQSISLIKQEKLSAKLVACLIEKVIVREKEIHIVYKFKNQFEQMAQLAEKRVNMEETNEISAVFTHF